MDRTAKGMRDWEGSMNRCGSRAGGRAPSAAKSGSIAKAEMPAAHLPNGRKGGAGGGDWGKLVEPTMRRTRKWLDRKTTKSTVRNQEGGLIQFGTVVRNGEISVAAVIVHGFEESAGITTAYNNLTNCRCFVLRGAAGFCQKAGSMRIIRPEQSWKLIVANTGERICLHRLALKSGYRLGEMCGDLGISERYFYQVFVRDIGLAPKDWMRRERMVVARRKLIGGKRPEEVAAELGFSNPNNFRREFLATYKVPPLQFQLERWGLAEEWQGVSRGVEDVIVRMEIPRNRHAEPGEWEMRRAE
jgi:AraC-like DNA-binding protein